MSDHDTAALLARYLEGETSPEENELIERWITENNLPASQWQTMDRPGRDQWLSTVFADIRSSIHQGDPQVIALAPKRRIPWSRMAAAAVMLMVSLAVYLEWPALRNLLHPAQLTALQVPVHEKRQITLPDGSQVWVNEGSELRYPQVFSRKTREVYLSGEAYFDIKHHPDQPFIIHTGNLVTTVLGTAFDIREDKNKHTVEVTVTRGKVSVANGDQLLGILTPNQQISFNSAKNELIKQTVDANTVIAWQQGELHFDDLSFEEAALQLQAQFNVKISFMNPKLKTCRFTGTALKGEKLDKILKVICAFNQATYQTRADGSIWIDGPGCN